MVAVRLPVDALTAHAVAIEDTRLQKKETVCGQAIIAILDPRQTYRLLGHDGKLVRMADSRHAQVLVMRRLIVGTINGNGQLIDLRVAPTKTVAQVQNVMKLKPPRLSICNKATVVKDLPSNYTHRSSLMKGY